MAQRIRYQTSARTHIGQVREHNQDNVWLLSGSGFVCGAVVDGMGDGTEGIDASQTVIQCIETIFQDQRSLANLNDEALAQMLSEALKTANQRILDFTPRAGTSVTAAILHELWSIIAHVGEGRAYIVDTSKNQGIQLTTDHIVMMPLIALDDWEPQDLTPKSVVYRALGQEETIEIDKYFIRLQVGDRLIICTDGLYRHVDINEMKAITLGEQNPEYAMQKLIDLANERGGEDNISVVIIVIEEDNTEKSDTP